VKAFALVAPVVASVVAAAAGVDSSQAGLAASRIIDRTVICQMPGEGFPDVTRFTTISADDRPPSISVLNGPSFELRASLRTRASGRESTGAVTFHREACVTTARRVALSPSGLTGRTGRAHHRCHVPGAILVRVRAMFRRPTGWVRGRETPSIDARGPIASATLVVATLKGSPIAFGSVHDARNRVRLLVRASRCRKQ
jgi:hypothetical protein